MSDADASSREGSLLAKLRERIRRSGPIPIDQYMAACAADPEHGYWRKADSIGAAGDFITAPEISQVFGELIGLWCVMAWQALGEPPLLRLIELGPGRGTLMRDALRAARTVPRFLAAARVHLVEASETLREVQRGVLPPPLWGRAGEGGIAEHQPPGRPSPLTPPHVVSKTRLRHDGEGNPPAVSWHEALDQVPDGPAIVIANEFLDALPIRQLVYDKTGWCERVIDLAPDGSLRFAFGSSVPALDAGGAPLAIGTIVESRPAEDELLAALAARKDPFAALFIDYGPAADTAGDTLQAVRRHAYVDPLTEPGAADLTAHVQFAHFAAKARGAGLAADGPIAQAQFLGALGIAERAARLMAANPDLAGSIEAGVQRLMSPTGMGQLFKAMLVRSPALPPQFPFV
jgi:NADH dehydrogenase [ubiquinone] 1 alpha subcomplex assembly factor 7